MDRNHDGAHVHPDENAADVDTRTGAGAKILNHYR